MSHPVRTGPEDVVLREAVPDDDAAVLGLVTNLSAGSLRRRFTGATASLELLAQLIAIGKGSAVVLAVRHREDGTDDVGEARYVRAAQDLTDVAELAVTLWDDTRAPGRPRRRDTSCDANWRPRRQLPCRCES